MKRLLGLSALALLLIVACTGPFDSPPPAPSQPIINNITPSGDGGTTVLLTVVGIAAFLFFGIAIAALMWGTSEHRRRKDAEGAVEAITGRPINQLRMLIASPISSERLQAMGLSTNQHAQLER